MEPVSSYRMNFGELVSRVYLMIDDPAGERFSEAVVKAALNDALVEIALETQLIIATATVGLKENQHLYDVNEVIDAAGGKAFGYPLRMVYDDADNAALSPFATAQFDLSGIRMNEDGRPLYWRTDILPGGQVMIFPHPSDDGSTLPALTGNLQVTYVAYPDAMVDDTDYPDTLSGQYHETLAERAAAMLLDEGVEEDMAVSDSLDASALAGVGKIISDQYRGLTQYDSARPM